MRKKKKGTTKKKRDIAPAKPGFKGSLKLVEGRRYVRRDGLVTDALWDVSMAEGLADKRFKDPKFHWVYNFSGALLGFGSETKHDLVEEYTAEDEALDNKVREALLSESPPEPTLLFAPDKETREVMGLVMEELKGARSTFPAMTSLHEAFSILLEEVDELKAEVQKKQLVKVQHGPRSGQRVSNIEGRTKLAKKEAIQVAAMAMRLIIDCCLEGGPSYGK